MSYKLSQCGTSYWCQKLEVSSDEDLSWQVETSINSTIFWLSYSSFYIFCFQLNVCTYCKSSCVQTRLESDSNSFIWDVTNGTSLDIQSSHYNFRVSQAIDQTTWRHWPLPPQSMRRLLQIIPTWARGWSNGSDAPWLRKTAIHRSGCLLSGYIYLIYLWIQCNGEDWLVGDLWPTGSVKA